VSVVRRSYGRCVQRRAALHYSRTDTDTDIDLVMACGLCVLYEQCVPCHAQTAVKFSGSGITHVSLELPYTTLCRHAHVPARDPLYVSNISRSRYNTPQYGRNGTASLHITSRTQQARQFYRWCVRACGVRSACGVRWDWRITAFLVLP